MWVCLVDLCCCIFLCFFLLNCINSRAWLVSLLKRAFCACKSLITDQWKIYWECLLLACRSKLTNYQCSNANGGSLVNAFDLDLTLPLLYSSFSVVESLRMKLNIHGKLCYSFSGVYIMQRVVFNVIFSLWFSNETTHKQQQQTIHVVKWIWVIFFLHYIGNEKFQQPYYKSFKVGMRYNFNYCSQFNLRIINLYIFHFGVLLPCWKFELFSWWI